MSCLVSRLRYYLDISEDDEKLVLELEKQEVNYKARRTLNLQQQKNNLFILKRGWLYRYEAVPLIRTVKAVS